MKKYSLEGRKEIYNSIEDLIDFILSSGICPSIRILKDGNPTGETAEDFLVA
tara:strand:- start:601 stop:756 length:156 start_codon:yes stop_codon:yes gene_type:complete